jgi:hypothetical protein
LVDVRGDLPRFVANAGIRLFLWHCTLNETRKLVDGEISMKGLFVGVGHSLPVAAVAADALLLKDGRARITRRRVAQR